MPRRPLFATLALLALLTPKLLPAQADLSDADSRAIRAYTLTMPKLRQLDQAMTEMRRQEEADPAFRSLQQKKKELAALEQKDNPSQADEQRMAKLGEEIAAAEEGDDASEEDNPASLDELAARMAADPRIAGALKRSGLEPREAAVMQFALFQAGLTAELLDQGAIKEIPKEANAANVKFYQANKAAIAAMGGLKQEERDE
jgi:hypothetical protein